MMDVVTDEQIEEIVLIKCTQTGGTEIILNVMGYFIHQDPSPILNVNPNKTMAETFSIDRFSPMVRDMPELKELVLDQALMKKTSNTILHKSFPGGHLTMATAASPSSLASRPVRILLMDEIDKYENTKEGDPMILAERRTSEFWNRKIIYCSSPRDAGTSRIDKKFNASDQRYYFVPCRKCGEFQKLEWAQIKWDKDDAGDVAHVWYECIHCQAQLQDRDKGWMIKRGEWRKKNPKVKHIAGFHISTLYSVTTNWKTVVQKFLDSKHNPEELRIWVNTYLGQVWEEQSTVKIETEDLVARCETYENVPMGVRILTAGVDVQDDRLEVKIKGWGLHDESWMIAREVFYGSPGRGDTWQLLYDYLLQPWAHESGLTLYVQGACIDSGGHFTQQVYSFCKKHQDRRFIAVKGLGGYGKLFIGKASRNNKQRALLIPLGVDTAKELIYDRLQIEDEGPGYMHFNGRCDEEYFKQLTAEKQVTRYNKGFPSKVWQKKSGVRNEALDLEVYAMAAFQLLNANMPAIDKRMQHDIEQLDSQAKKPSR